VRDATLGAEPEFLVNDSRRKRLSMANKADPVISATRDALAGDILWPTIIPSCSDHRNSGLSGRPGIEGDTDRRLLLT
jgi:hypothetical protein